MKKYLCIEVFSDWVAGAPITPSWTAFSRPFFWSHSKHSQTHQTSGPQWSSAACCDWLIHVPVLQSSQSLWSLISSWLCPPSVDRSAGPVMNIQRSSCLTGLSLFPNPLGTIIQSQKNKHNGSSSPTQGFSLSYTYSLCLSISSGFFWTRKHASPRKYWI